MPVNRKRASRPADTPGGQEMKSPIHLPLTDSAVPLADDASGRTKSPPSLFAAQVPIVTGRASGCTAPPRGCACWPRRPPR